MYEYAFRPFILIVHSCLGPVLSLYVFVCILRVLSFILVQTRRVCLCPCKQANVFISSYMCSMFLSVLHKDELMLWFVLHAVRLYRHANTSQQPAVWIIHYVRKHCFPVENIYFRFSFSEMNSRWYATITKEKKKSFARLKCLLGLGAMSCIALKNISESSGWDPFHLLLAIIKSDCSKLVIVALSVVSGKTTGLETPSVDISSYNRCLRQLGGQLSKDGCL